MFANPGGRVQGIQQVRTCSIGRRTWTCICDRLPVPTPLESTLPIPMTSDQIYEDLADRIRTGEYPPGTELPTYIELAALYGVGRTTVSVILKRLKDAGLVVGVRGRGVFVSEDVFG